jgi:lipopolysaccharide biosynthesis regulator YciM
MENGALSRYTFLNTVSSALKTLEFDWAEQFIREFQPFLEDKHRNGTVNFSLSRLYFEKGDYGKAQQFLTQFEYDDMLQNIVAKTMLLKIYYERDDLDAFESLLESMRTYLQRKEALDPSRKMAYKNMISAMKKLLHLNIFSKPQRESFREMVQKTNPLMERDWLLEQVERK